MGPSSAALGVERRPVEVAPGVAVGGERLALLAGPCVIESRELVLDVAAALREIAERLNLPFVFKASFDKANRTSGSSFRSLGFERSLAILDEVRQTLRVPVVTDVHETWQIEPVAEVVDLLQIPAFLCRQTDLLCAAAASGRPLNIKKGQFVAPTDMRYAVSKVTEAGGDRVLLTERGTTFGYRDLVVDFRGLEIMRELAPVVFDVTHSIQAPGGAEGSSGGRREHAPALARAASAVGIDGLFVETHPNPAEALSDGPSMIPLPELEPLLRDCLAIRTVSESVRS